MKELVLVRHAKSDRDNLELKDIDRPLNARGYSDAYRLSTWYAQEQKKPELILSSSATRAFTTALIFARALNQGAMAFHLEPEIYEAGTGTLLKVLRRQSASVKSIMMVGHNPGFTDLCNLLTVKDLIDNLPTCGIMAFQVPIDDWKDLKEGGASLKFYQFPKIQGSIS